MNLDKEQIACAFGANVRARRQRLLISQEALAAFAELHRTEVGLLERGKRMPRLDTILRLAAALSTEPAELLRGLDVRQID